MSNTPDFRAELQLLFDAIDHKGVYVLGHNIRLTESINRARTALATPPTEPPTDGDKEESERLRSLFDWTRHQMADALGADRGYGWTSLAMEARQLREALEAQATPPTEPPTDDERLADFAQWLAREMPRNTIIGDPLWWAPRIAHAVLERWG